MSSTRIAKPGGPLRQERFCSSPEFDRGLKANLVAKRCRVLNDPQDREIVWFLQRQSLLQGGMKALADLLIQQHREELFSKWIQKCSTQSQETWTGNLIVDICDELDLWRFFDGYTHLGNFSARGERRDVVDAIDLGLERGFTRENVLSACIENAKLLLADHLERLCLDPGVSISNSDPSFVTGLKSAVLKLSHNQAEMIRNSMVETSIGRKMQEACRFALKTRSMVVVKGEARIGKSSAAKQWCESNSGLARFAQVPSSTDDVSFLRAIAQCLGVSINLNSKALELRTRIEETLQNSGLLLCLDEAHYLLPQSNYRDALPQRISWLMTALSNFQVPIVLIVTPQFFDHQRRLEEKTFWNGTQFTGRVSRFVELPSVLPSEDLRAIAESLLPEIGPEAIDVLVKLARSSTKSLATIDSVVRTARFFASEDNRTDVSVADFAMALREQPASDSALAKAREKSAARRPPRGRDFAALLPQPGAGVAAPLRHGLDSDGFDPREGGEKLLVEQDRGEVIALG